MSTVTADNTRVNDSTSNASWGNYNAGGQSPSSEPQLAYQGGSVVNKKVTTTTSRSGVDYDPGSGGVDMSGSGLWMMKGKVADAGDLNATYGVEGAIGSANSAFHAYNVAGSGANNDQFISGYSSQGGLAEGYLIIGINPNIAEWRESTSGSPDLAAVDWYALGAQFVTGGAKSENVALDAIDIGTGLTYSGASFSFQDGVDFDQGVVTNRFGYSCAVGTAIFLRGIHTVNATGTDESSVFFPDGYHGTGDCGIAGNSSSLTLAGNYQGLGRKYATTDTRPDYTQTGTVLVSGAITNHRSVQLTATHTVTGTLEAESITITGADITGATIRTQAEANTATVADFNFASTGVRFIQKGAGHAIEITTPGAYTLNNVEFIGYGTDDSASAAIVNSSGGTVDINISGGSSPTVTPASSTNVIISLSVTFTGIPDGLEARIKQGSRSLDHSQNITGGSYSYPYATPGELVQVSIGGAGYVRRTLDLILPASSQTIPLEFAPDPSYVS